jgi:hypothetical protein
MVAREQPKEGFADEFPSNADGDSSASIAIARATLRRVQTEAVSSGPSAGHVSGATFEQITRSFVQEALRASTDSWPGKWRFDLQDREALRLPQCRHFAKLSALAAKDPETAALLASDHVITPDVVVVREIEPRRAISAGGRAVDGAAGPRSSPRQRNSAPPILHASISCKWRLRSNRSEAVSLINRNGRLPHVAVVTGEPMPGRLASFVLGTRDLDCVYHFALPELTRSIKTLDFLGIEDSAYLLKIMVQGGRLKDISDLPVDLAV